MKYKLKYNMDTRIVEIIRVLKSLHTLVIKKKIKPYPPKSFKEFICLQIKNGLCPINCIEEQYINLTFKK